MSDVINGLRVELANLKPVPNDANMSDASNNASGSNRSGDKERAIMDIKAFTKLDTFKGIPTGPSWIKWKKKFRAVVNQHIQHMASQFWTTLNLHLTWLLALTITFMRAHIQWRF